MRYPDDEGHRLLRRTDAGLPRVPLVCVWPMIYVRVAVIDGLNRPPMHEVIMPLGPDSIEMVLTPKQVQHAAKAAVLALLSERPTAEGA